MIKTFSRKDVSKLLPTRKKSDNKTRGGKSLVIAGSSGMEGAALLCARAAARSGSGYVYLFSSSDQLLNLKQPDFLTLKSKKQFDEINFNSIAIGPGFRNPKSLKQWLNKLQKINFKNVVLDAEALSYLSENNIKIPSTWILTPHEGELAKLLKVSSSVIRKDRIRYTRIAQKKYGCVVLLKGAGTLIVDNKRSTKITSGNASLAKAGTGDVLTGMIVAFLSQDIQPYEAATLAAYIHGYMADSWINQGRDYLSLMASDLVEMLPKTLAQLRR